MNVIDLFAGAGGLSNGFRKAGFNILLANEIDKSIAESYKKNHKETFMINDDIKNILPKLDKLNKKIDVIIGGPPCQGFSMSGARIRESKSNKFLDDPRNYLFRNYFEIVKKIEPTFFIMENVPGILSMKNGIIIEEIEKLFTDELNFKSGRYYIYKKVLNSADYGVPQERHRLIIFGSKYNVNYENIFQNVKNVMTKNGQIVMHNIFDAISDLNYLESGEGEFRQKYLNAPITNYQRDRRKDSSVLFNHVATNHNALAVDRISRIPQGGRRLDLEEGIKIKSVHSGAYGRMRWNELAKTIITRFDTPSSGVYIHPEKNRTLTPREAARLQSFDDDYVFYGNKSSIIKQIGNAVPPLLAFYLANVVLEINKEEN